MEIKLTCICSNSQSSIYNTLISYIGIINEYYLLINNTTDNTYNEIKRFKKDTNKKIYIYFEQFTTFDKVRNSLLDKVLPFNGYILFIDDSYELKEFPNINNLSGECYNVNVKCNNLTYPRTLLFKPWIRYIHEIHEIPNVNPIATVNILLEDVQYPDQILRTIQRRKNDIKLLSKNLTIRNQYYISICDKESRREFILKHRDNPNAREYIYLLALISNETYLLLISSLVYKELAAITYYTLFNLTKNRFFLKKAHENAEVIPNVTVPFDRKLFEMLHFNLKKAAILK